LIVSLPESITVVNKRQPLLMPPLILFLMLAAARAIPPSGTQTASWLPTFLHFFCRSQIMLLLSYYVVTATASVITSPRQLVLTPLSCFHPCPLCNATTMPPSCTLWFIINIFIATLLLLLLSLSLSRFMVTAISPLLCKPVPVSHAFLCLNVAVACSLVDCCLKSILTVTAIDAHCLHCCWNQCGCYLLMLLVDCFHVDFYFSLCHCLRRGRCRIYSAMTVMCLACTPLPATSTPFDCCFIFYFSCCHCFHCSLHTKI